MIRRTLEAPVRRLRHDRRVGEGLRFLVATGFSAGLSLGTPPLLHEWLGVPAEIAVAAALVLVFCVNFVVVRTYVFRSTGPALRQIAQFAVTSGLFRAGEYALFLLLFKVLALHYLVALVIALGLSFVGKFFVTRDIIFKSA